MYHAAKKTMLTTSLKRFQRIGLNYVNEPKHKTRSEMLEARRRAMLPPLSYDFNGDGVVDNFELFLGTRLDTNGDGEISQTERARGKELLEELKKNFVFGLDVRALGAGGGGAGGLVHGSIGSIGLTAPTEITVALEQAAGANNQAYADIEQRAKRQKPGEDDEGEEAVRAFVSHPRLWSCATAAAPAVMQLPAHCPPLTCCTAASVPASHSLRPSWQPRPRKLFNRRGQ